MSKKEAYIENNILYIVNGYSTKVYPLWNMHSFVWNEIIKTLEDFNDE